jgi:photosystem II stability/assembly factor-like uncharacterized protein
MKKTAFGVWLCFLLTLILRPIAAQKWTPANVPNEYWTAVGCSLDGSRIVATGNSTLISSDFGANWGSGQLTPPTATALSIASSADGETVLIGANSYLYISHDWGLNWVATGPYTNGAADQWTAVASSSDGKRLLAAEGENGGNPGDLYLSTNSGVTWTQANVTSNDWCVAGSSADGRVLTAAGEATGYRSTNFGASWILNNLPPDTGNYARAGLTVSTDGTRQAAVSGNGSFYTSVDSGLTWQQQTNFSFDFATAMAASSDGSKLVVSGYAGGLVPETLFSEDYGTTWRLDTSAPPFAWTALCMSADGTRVVAGNSSNFGSDAPGGIYLYGPNLALKFTLTNGMGLLSWPAALTNVVLQQSTNLSDWVTTTNTPEGGPGGTNTEVQLPLSGTTFFRLSAQ